MARQVTALTGLWETLQTLLEQGAGLSVDMLDVDRLRQWADRIEIHGDRITEWGAPSFVTEKLRDIASRLDANVREVGQLRSALPALLAHLEGLQAQEAKTCNSCVFDSILSHCGRGVERPYPPHEKVKRSQFNCSEHQPVAAPVSPGDVLATEPIR